MDVFGEFWAVLTFYRYISRTYSDMKVIDAKSLILLRFPGDEEVSH